MTTRVSITVNAYETEKPQESKNYSVSFYGDFAQVRAEIDKIYEKNKTKEVEK